MLEPITVSVQSTLSFIKQAFPGKPQFTEQNVPDLSGKVAVVTGANTGLGKEIARILYAKNATVYIMARSEDKSLAAINGIRAASPTSTGTLTYIRLDQADLSTIRHTADTFLAREHKLHLLFNNAGVGYPPRGSRTPQGHELQLGVNCLGAFALTRALTPLLAATAQSSPRGTVRVVWVSSSAAEAVTPRGYVDRLESGGGTQQPGGFVGYALSKLGNYMHATEFATRYGGEAGVVSVPINPGNLDSDFWRTQGALTAWLLRRTLLCPPVLGAYTALFAAFGDEVAAGRPGQFVAPWGRLWKISDELVAAAKAEENGGTGMARRFWDWSEEQVKNYV